MAYTPKIKGYAGIYMTIPPYVTADVGLRVIELFFSGAYNGGVFLKASLFDTDIDRWNAFMKNVWFPKKLREDIKVNFQIKYDNSEYPELATRVIELSLTKCSMRSRGDYTGVILDLEATTTADYELSFAFASGKAYKGRISDVLGKVIQEHTSIKYSITPTLDNKENYWYMMRQRPPRFIRQLMEYGTMFTKSKTQLVYGVRQYAAKEKIEPLINIAPQGEIKPVNLGMYMNPSIQQMFAIGNEDYIATINKIASSGISTLTGDYIDIKTDPKELYCIVKDSNTSNKITAGYPPPHGYVKQNDAVGFLKGTSAMRTEPELYSDGSLGYEYKDYIRNGITNTFLNHTYNLMHARFEFPGIGLLDNTIGLGTHTIFILFKKPDTSGVPPIDKVLDDPDGPSQYHIWTGNWTIMGFEHRWSIDAKIWRTVVDCVRWTTNASAVRFSSQD